MFRKLALVYLLLTLLLGLPVVAQATNGYFAHGYGTKNKGMAGAGSALPQDSLAVANNPAGIAMLGERMDIGIALFNPNRQYKVTGNPSGGLGSFPLEPGTEKSGSEQFFIPHFGRTWAIDSEAVFGLAVYGNGGMNTDYDDHANPVRGFGGPPCSTSGGTFCAGGAGVNLLQLFIAPTYARKINETAAWGVTGIVAYQQFKATGLGTFGVLGFSSDAANLTDNGNDTSTGIGLRLGIQGAVTPDITLAFAYQPEIDMSEFDSYAGLFAEQGDFNIPANWLIGLAWNTSSRSTLTFDIQNISYSDVASVGNEFVTPPTAFLGDDDGAGFGWDDMLIYKFGYQWSTTENWTWRVGYSMTENPIPKKEVLLNTLAPGVIEQHLTFGFTKAMANEMEFSFAATHAMNSSVKGANAMDPVQTVELEMNQWEFEASWGWRY